MLFSGWMTVLQGPVGDDRPGPTLRPVPDRRHEVGVVDEQCCEG